MKRKYTAILLLFLLISPLFATVDPFARYPYLADEIVIAETLAENQKKWLDETAISLLTIGPGDPLYAWFGHSALILTQPSGSKIIYDWGVFDMSQEHFYLNFARGRMHYFIFATDGQWRIDSALDERRDVRLAELNLPDAGKLAVITYLHSFLEDGEGTYLYHFYDDNCATRIRDLIDVATGGSFASWAEAQRADGTFRSLTGDAMRHRPLIAWGLSALQGPSIDRQLNRWEAMALPLHLERAVHEFTHSDGSALIAEHTILQDVTHRDVIGRSHLSYAVIFSLILFALLQLLSLYLPTCKRILLGLIYLFLGVLGSALLFMMFASDMDMTYRNINSIVLNPLLIIAAVKMFRKRREGKSWLLTLFSAATIVLLPISCFITQEALGTLLVLLPLYLSGATLQRRAKVEEVEVD